MQPAFICLLCLPEPETMKNTTRLYSCPAAQNFSLGGIAKYGLDCSRYRFYFRFHFIPFSVSCSFVGIYFGLTSSLRHIIHSFLGSLLHWPAFRRDLVWVVGFLVFAFGSFTSSIDLRNLLHWPASFTSWRSFGFKVNLIRALPASHHAFPCIDFGFNCLLFGVGF